MSLWQSLWACSQWKADPELDNAVAQQNYGDPLGTASIEFDTGDYNTSDPGVPYSASEWYTELTRDWPDVSTPVIPESEYVPRDDEDFYQYWYDHWWKKGDMADEPECFDRAAYQLMKKAGHRTSEYRPESDSYYEVFNEKDGVNTNRTAEAVSYVKSALSRGVPVLAGLLLDNYNSRPNPPRSTNHFVVIVGSGQDDKGHYFRYYDSNHRQPSKEDKLYLTSALTLDGAGVRMTETRKTLEH